MTNKGRDPEEPIVRHGLLLAIVFLLCACAGTPASVPQGLKGDAAANSGVVFGSIGTVGYTTYSGFGLRYRMQGSKEEGEFRYTNNWTRIANTETDFDGLGGKGSVFSAKLPPGNYEIFNVRFFENRGTAGTSTFTSKQDFSVPFTVEEGKATYLGEFIARRVTGRNIIRMPVSAGGYYVVSDRFERDVAVLQKREASMPPKGIRNEVANVTQAGVPMLRATAIPDGE